MQALFCNMFESTWEKTFAQSSFYYLHVEKSQDMQSSNGSFAFRIFLSIIVDLLKERNSRNLRVLPQLPLIQVAKKKAPWGYISLVDSNRENSLFLVFVGHFFLGIFLLQNSSPQMFSILSWAREKDISGQIGQPIEKVRKLMKLRQQLYHSSIWSVSCLQENFYSFQTRNTKHSYSYWYFPKRG